MKKICTLIIINDLIVMSPVPPTALHIPVEETGGRKNTLRTTSAPLDEENANTRPQQENDSYKSEADSYSTGTVDDGEPLMRNSHHQ